MRVLLVHRLYKVTGGAEVFLFETGRILNEHGHDTFFVATGDETDLPVNVRLLKAPHYDNVGLLTKILNLPSSIYDRRKKAQMAEVITAFRPDIVHAFGVNVHLTPSVLAAAHEAHIPVVLTCNDYRHICPNYKLYHHGRICIDCKGERFFNAVKNRCCKEQLSLSVASAVEAYVHKAMDVYGRYVDAFTFSSDFMAEVTHTFWPNRPIVWGKLRNPFDRGAYIPSSDYLPYGLYFGRLIEEKGVDKLMEAAALIDRFPIKIVGTGPDETKLRSMVAERKLTNVEFLGPLWGTDLDNLLRTARFVVVPSVWHENFPYVINQSFALARPVIGTRRGGINELVEDGVRGLLYDADDVQSLAAAIRLLAADPLKAAAMGSAAKAYSDNVFEDNHFYADLMAIYQRAADAHSRSWR